MKSNKNSAKVLAQAICNISDLIYPPEKANMVFEQKVSLKFHKALGPATALKQYASLSLNVKSVIKQMERTPRNVLKNLENGGKFNFENASQIPDDMSMMTESFAFDFEESSNMGNNFDSILFEESPIRNYNTGEGAKGAEKNDMANMSMKVETHVVDLNDGCKTARNRNRAKNQSRNFENIENQRISLSSQKLSQDTTNSSHLRHHSYCGDITSEKSYIEKDSALSVLKEQFEREKSNCKIANNQNEALLLQKAEFLHKITQLQDQLKNSEENEKNLRSENETLKSKNEELINSQYANASDKLNMLALDLENKEEEMRTALGDKSVEIQQIKSILDAKQSQIAKMNANLESKDCKIKTLESNIKLLEGEVKSKSKEISTFEFSTKTEIESSVKEKELKIIDLKKKLSMKVVRLTKQEEKVGDLTKQLSEEKEECNKIKKIMNERIEELKKLNEETTNTYKNKIYQRDNELETVKKDIQSQKNRIYTAVDSVKAELGMKISERDIIIEKLKNKLNIKKSEDNPKKSKESHWIIETNLREIISEHKQKLIKEKTKREQLEKDIQTYAEMLVKTKAEWANCEHEKEMFKFEALKKDEVIEEYETEYEKLEKEYQKILKKSKK